MRTSRLAVPSVLLSVLALAACSSAPDDSASTNEDLIVIYRAPCQSTSPNGASTVSPPDASRATPGSRAAYLATELHCSAPGLYHWTHNLMPFTETYVLCPTSNALSAWLLRQPDFGSVPSGVHPNAAACDVSLAPAPAGDTYIFWGASMDCGMPTCVGTPTCQGSNCKSYSGF